MTSGITAVAVVEMMERNANIRAKRAGTRNSFVIGFILTSPYVLEAKLSQLRKSCFCEVDACPGDLVASLYAKRSLAKMTGLPDELIETPDR